MRPSCTICPGFSCGTRGSPGRSPCATCSVHRSGSVWERVTCSGGHQARTPAVEIARRLRYPSATSFRSAYAYDNVLYLVAGEVVEAASGQRWEAFVGIAS